MFIEPFRNSALFVYTECLIQKKAVYCKSSASKIDFNWKIIKHVLMLISFCLFSEILWTHAFSELLHEDVATRISTNLSVSYCGEFLIHLWRKISIKFSGMLHLSIGCDLQQNGSKVKCGDSSADCMYKFP